MLTLKNIFKNYGDHKVLEGVNLMIGKGDIHGVVGKNGSGKTTLFRCIGGLEDSGGEVIYEHGILKNQTGFLPTDPFFFSFMTGHEYLQLLCNARNIKIGNISDFNLFDLPLKQYAETYSTGMKKKLALTGLLLQRNEVFLLDEPFNGVDIAGNMIINDVLLKLKSLGKIILMSSHIFSSLEDTCDQLHYLKDGKFEISRPKGSFDLIENEMKTANNASNIVANIYAI